MHSHKDRLRRKKFRFILMGAGTLLPLLGVGAATASLLPGEMGQNWQDWVMGNLEHPLERVLTRIERIDPIFETIMEVALGEAWQDVQRTVGSDSPNPYEVRTASEDVPGSGVLTLNSIIRNRDIANLYDQEMARSLASPMLGEMGDTFMAEEGTTVSDIIEVNQSELQEAQQLAVEAQSLSVTQDVVKNQTAVQSALLEVVANQSQLTADSYVTLLEMQRLNSIIAQVSANTSEGVDETNRRARVERQVEISGAAATPLYIPGLFRPNREDS